MERVRDGWIDGLGWREGGRGRAREPERSGQHT